MTKGDHAPSHALPGGRTTLDDLFRRAGVRHPDALALVDPPDRERIMSGPPRRMTYAETDRAVSAVAGRLQRLGLPAGSVVSFQIPHTVESIITLLGILRAGFVAAPLPLLWRQADMTLALRRIGARVLICGGRESGSLAADVGASVFPIRYVCGFGPDLPESVIGLDNLLEWPLDNNDAPHASAEPAAPVAIITWDVTPDGLMPMARSQPELIAAGLAVLLEARPPEDAVILSTCPAGALAGLALGPLLWLLTGGTLVLHHPFDARIFAQQCLDEGCDTAILPGPLVPALREAGVLPQAGLRRLLALWRAPEHAAASAPWTGTDVALIDILIFGETGLLAARRGTDGYAAPVPLGPVTAPRGAAGAVLVATTARTAQGTLALGGPMVPQTNRLAGERTGGPRSEPDLQTDLEADLEAAGCADTFHACRIEGDRLAITRPPPGIVAVGGYRFLLRDLQTRVQTAGSDTAISVMPDEIGGDRLEGDTGNREAIQAALAQAGLNPLIIDAFRDQTGSSSA